MIVMKFGGSSVESAEAIARVARIVRDRLDQRPVVVVSAMGKTTNKLLAIGAKAVSGELAAALDSSGTCAVPPREALGTGVERNCQPAFRTARRSGQGPGGHGRADRVGESDQAFPAKAE